MAGESYTADDLAHWERLVGSLSPVGRPGPGDERAAVEATANMCSAWGGWMDMPKPIADIIERAIEAGYLAALEHVRQGRIGGLGTVEG